MKAAFFTGDQQFEMREMNRLQPGPEEVVIRTRACGICGTDIHIYNGEEGSASPSLPVVLGHEFSGQVTAVGPDVLAFKAGDKVTVDPNIYCGKCSYCKSGQKQFCENLTAVGVNQNGGFAQYCCVPEKQCYKLDEHVRYEDGALSEPLACCVHGIERIQMEPGQSVCVIGGGPIGLLMLQLASMQGAAKIVLSEPSAVRRKIGLELGADFAVDPVNSSLKQVISEQISTEGVDVVIECVGQTAAVKGAFEAAKRGSRILLFSVPKPDAVYPVPLFDLFKKELTIAGSFINPDTMQKAVNLINGGRISTAPLITHRFPLEAISDAFLAQMSDESIKVIIEP